MLSCIAVAVLSCHGLYYLLAYLPMSGSCVGTTPGAVGLYHRPAAHSQRLSFYSRLRARLNRLGYGFLGCGGVDHPILDNYTQPTAFAEDYGVAKGICRRKPGTQKGVYEREYSHATVTMDCNTWTGTIKMSDGRLVDTSV